MLKIFTARWIEGQRRAYLKWFAELWTLDEKCYVFKITFLNPVLIVIKILVIVHKVTKSVRLYSFNIRNSTNSLNYMSDIYYFKSNSWFWIICFFFFFNLLNEWFNDALNKLTVNGHHLLAKQCNRYHPYLKRISFKGHSLILIAAAISVYVRTINFYPNTFIIVWCLQQK